MLPGWRVSAERFADRDAWLELRREDVTASEVGALFGVHKYLTPRKLAFEKAYGEHRVQNAAMRRGKIMEPAVAEAVHLDHGWKMRRSDTYLRARADDPLVRMGATRDYHLHLTREELMRSTLRDQAVALGWDRLDEISLATDCKSVDPHVFDAEWGETAPKYILVQAAQQALLGDHDGAVVACLIENRSKDLLLYAVPRRPNFELELVNRVREFWRRYADGDEYPVAAGDNGEMASYFPVVETGQVVSLEDEADLWIERATEIRRLKGEIKARDARIDHLEALFKDALRGADRAVLRGWNISWKADSKGKRRFLCEPAKTKRTSR